MKKIAFLAIAFLMIFSLNSKAQNRPEMGSVCKAYIGEEGLRITTCRIGSPENNEVLLGIMGIDHPWSGKIFKAKVRKYDGKEDYEITVDGKSYVIMTYRDYYEVYLTEYGTTKATQYVAYNQDASQECKPEWLLTEYFEQK